MPDSSVFQYLPEFAHFMSNEWWCYLTISSFAAYPLFCLSLSQHHVLFHCVGSSHQVAKALELHLQQPSFRWILRVDFLRDWLVWSPCCPWDSWVFSSTAIWNHQFFSTQPSLWYNSHICTWLLGKYIALTIRICVSKVMSVFINCLSRFVTAFLSRSNCLLISWLQSPSRVILEPKKIKSVTASFYTF